MREHELKTWPEPFAAILDGRKAFEIRKNDRGFSVGDTLRLREWAPDHDGAPPFGTYTGRELRVRVTYLVPGGKWDLPDELCVMGIATPPQSAPAPDYMHPCAHCGYPMAGHVEGAEPPIACDEYARAASGSAWRTEAPTPAEITSNADPHGASRWWKRAVSPDGRELWRKVIPLRPDDILSIENAVSRFEWAPCLPPSSAPPGSALTPDERAEVERARIDFYPNADAMALIDIIDRITGAPTKNAPPFPFRRKCGRTLRSGETCSGDVMAEQSVDGSCWERDRCNACGASWFNDPPKPWPSPPGTAPATVRGRVAYVARAELDAALLRATEAERALDCGADPCASDAHGFAACARHRIERAERGRP